MPKTRGILLCLVDSYVYYARQTHEIYPVPSLLSGI